MKRRDFIQKSIGTIGLLAAPKVMAICSPKNLMVAGGQKISDSPSCSPIGSGSSPAWFNNMPERTWATPVKNFLNDVKPSPLPPGAEGQSAVCDDWTGGTADQSSGEFIIPAQGGHNGYYGNEVYALALREQEPIWKRVSNPTPNGSIQTDNPGYNGRGDYLDGQPRSVHGYNRPCCSSDGRVWLAGLDAFGSPIGQWTTACWSFDNRNRAQGWKFHGIGIADPPQPFNSAFSWLSGPAAYDRVGNRVWSAAAYALGKGGYSVDVATNKITPYNWYLSGNPFGYAWSVVAHDLRLWIVGSVNESRLWILDLENVQAGWFQKNTNGSPHGFNSGSGAVYHQPSRAILNWNDNYGASIRALRIPSDPRNGTYTWFALNPSNSNSITPAPNPRYPARTYSKFQIIEDMGNGQSALCTVNHVTSATYVFKLPKQGV